MLARGAIVDGKYRVVRLIGEGGMGAVYEGRNVRLNRPVAIKIMHAAMTGDRQLVERFEREAQAAARIGSTHIADVLDLGELPDGDRYMVMEYLEGESLAARLKARSQLSPPESAAIAVQLLEGLDKVHEAGIIHRDLKPANIFLAKGEGGADFVKILDFGICKMRSKAKGELSTGVGNLLGTLGYMCPEQIEHGPKAMDARADIYAVGVVLYRCVTGTLPYRASNLVELLHRMREGRPARVTDLVPGVDPKFAAIVDKAIEWEPKARFQSARALQKALVAWLSTVDRLARLLGDFLERPELERPPTGSIPPAPRATATSDDSIDVEIDDGSVDVDVEAVATDPVVPAPQQRTEPKRRRRETAPGPKRGQAARITRVDLDVEIDDEAATLPRIERAPAAPRARPRTRK